MLDASKGLTTPWIHYRAPTAVVEEPEGEGTPDTSMAIDLVEYEAEGLEPHGLAEVYIAQTGCLEKGDP